MGGPPNWSSMRLSPPSNQSPSSTSVCVCARVRNEGETALLAVLCSNTAPLGISPGQNQTTSLPSLIPEHQLVFHYYLGVVNTVSTLGCWAVPDLLLQSTSLTSLSFSVGNPLGCTLAVCWPSRDVRPYYTCLPFLLQTTSPGYWKTFQSTSSVVLFGELTSIQFMF